MAEITITEALAEIKTIQARIVKRKEAVMRYFARDARLRDPMEAEGGSGEFVKRERQAIGDLEGRIVDIRTAIQSKNLATIADVRGMRRSVAGWLNWRRDVSTEAKRFLVLMASGIDQARAQAQRSNAGVAGDEKEAKAGDFIISVNERELASETEEMEALLGELDGRLSLINATTTITV